METQHPSLYNDSLLILELIGTTPYGCASEIAWQVFLLLRAMMREMFGVASARWERSLRDGIRANTVIPGLRWYKLNVLVLRIRFVGATE